LWGGKPLLAFICSKFQFFDGQACLIPPQTLFTFIIIAAVLSGCMLGSGMTKEPKTISVCKYPSTEDPILDPADAAVSLIHPGANLLKVPEWEPIGFYGSTSSCQFYFLHNHHVQDALCKIYVRTYPDPAH
jgi:hypothetical protein